MENKGLIIAVDGFSSCGKSTFAKAIAAKFGYIFIDTGAMYRVVTLAAMRANLISAEGEVDSAEVEKLLKSVEITFKFNEARGASDAFLNGECVEKDIRLMEVSSRVSLISAIGAVREMLVALQQEMGRKGGVVMDGRDIGTVVFPDADIKLFMTADPAVRAQRRYDELTAKGESVSLNEITQNVVARDEADMSRKISPLKQAEDAIVLDNGAMSVEQQMAWFVELYEKTPARAK
ncbi:MAG: (d)CMP kinase [Rikenellaceae bacterium]